MLSIVLLKLMLVLTVFGEDLWIAPDKYRTNGSKPTLQKKQRIPCTGGVHSFPCTTALNQTIAAKVTVLEQKQAALWSARQGEQSIRYGSL